MNIDSKNRRWPHLGETWLTPNRFACVITDKTGNKLIVNTSTTRTHAGVCSAGSEFNLITYLK